MTTRAVVQRYFDRVREKQGWEPFLSDEMQFTIFTSPMEHVTDRTAILARLTRFYSLTNAVEVKDISQFGF